MAILDSNQTISKSGFRKTLDRESEEVILNIVQVAIYQFPYKSMIREVVSNALDSIKEKEVAKILLQSPERLSEFYEDREGEIYNNSRFKPEYYDVDHLDINNLVTISYYNRAALERDLLSIKDTGVGLGGVRLQKFFIPGASTKRLNKTALGKYGIGNKSPLSTGVESYRLISVYNGKKFIFDIYSDKIDSIVPKFNDNGTINKFVTFNDIEEIDEEESTKVYYLETSEKNSVEIQVEVKSHNKHMIHDAIKSQLMYFKEDIRFYEYAMENSEPIEHAFKSNIIYEDDDIVLSDSNYYNRPHFVINGVSYGLVDFRELELDTRFGNIGLKFKMEDLEVTPSRESVIYNQKTRTSVLEAYKKLTTKVEALIESKLKVTDYLTWLNTATNIISGGAVAGEDVILGRLSNLIDRDKLTFKYNHKGHALDYNRNVKSLFGKYLSVDTIFIENKYKNGTYKYYLNRGTSSIYDLKSQLYFQDTTLSVLKTSYAIKSSKDKSIVLMKLNFKTEEEDLQDITTEFLSGTLSLEDAIKKGSIIIKNNKLDDSDESKASVKYNTNAFKTLIYTLDALNIGKDSVKLYSSIEVPDDYHFNEGDLVDTEAEKRESLKLRKALGKFNIKVVCFYEESYTGNKHISFKNLTVTADQLENINIIYCTTQNRRDLENYVNLIGGEDCCKYPTPEELKGSVFSSMIQTPLVLNGTHIFCVIAEANKKHFTDQIHLIDHLMVIDNRKLSVPEHLKLFLTHEVLKDDFNNKLSSFQSNGFISFPAYKIINSAHIFTSRFNVYPKFSEFATMLNKHYTYYDGSDLLTKLVNIAKIQYEICKGELDDEELDSMKVGILGIDLTDDIDDFDIIDTSIYEFTDHALEYIKVFGDVIFASGLSKNSYNIKRILDSHITSEDKSIAKICIDNMKLRKDKLVLEHEGLNI